MGDDVGGRHVESLLREYGELSRSQAEQAVQIKTLGERELEHHENAEDDRRAIREEMEKMELRVLAAIGRSEQRQRELIGSVKESCDKGWAEWKRWVEAYTVDQKTARQADRQHGLARWMLIVGVVSAIIAAAACVIGLLAFLTGAA